MHFGFFFVLPAISRVHLFCRCVKRFSLIVNKCTQRPANGGFRPSIGAVDINKCSLRPAKCNLRPVICAVRSAKCSIFVDICSLIVNKCIAFTWYGLAFGKSEGTIENKCIAFVWWEAAYNRSLGNIENTNRADGRKEYAFPHSFTAKEMYRHAFFVSDRSVHRKKDYAKRH